MPTRSEAYHDYEAPAYDAKYDGIPFYGKVYEPVTWDNIRRFLPPLPAQVLDAGGGTGRWTVVLAKMGYEVTLTDISQGMLDVARGKIEAAGLSDRVTIMRQDIRDMSALGADSFDLVLAEGDPVGYCEDHAAAIGELARVAKVGAHVIVSVDSRVAALFNLSELDFDAAEALLRTGQMKWRVADEALAYPIHAFTIPELAGLFEANGLRVARVLGKPVFLNRLRPEARDKILADEELTRRLVELECRYGDDPGWAGSGGHIEVTGVKVW
ncbi:MAG: class I SAM-dependent methyltransferase [Anaerolineae bacterium]|nr:class I SAM-dependent methyltransferase [Anaerolineae bacterium]